MKVKNDHRSKCWTWASCLKLISTWQAKSFFDGMDQRALEISKQCLFLFSAFRPVMFSCCFFVVSVLFWSFFSFVSLFCFSFPFVYFSIFSNPGWHASLFESSNLAKCFKFAGRRTLMICCTWRWLKIMTPLTGSEIARP